MIFRGHSPGEVQRGAGNVGVDVNPAWQNNHACRVDCGSAVYPRNNAAIGDADLLKLSVDAVCGIVDFSARYPQHGVSLLLDRA